MQIECKIYNLTEFKQALKISKRQWEERKEELLEYLKIFFDYSITMAKRGYCIEIKQQLCEYEPMPRKSKMPEMLAFYEQETDHIIQYKPRNTGSNIAREIAAHNNKYEHAEGTIANYIRPVLKRNYAIGEREWCEIDYEHFTYNPINEHQLNFLKEQFKKYLSSDDVADTIGDVEAGYITQDEAYKRLKSHYNDAMDAFKNEYGFRPYKAGELMRKAWVEEE